MKKTAKAPGTVNVRWFKDKIKKANSSQRKIAKEMGIHQSILSHIFSGTRKLSLQEAAQLSAILSVPVPDIMVNAGIQRELLVAEPGSGMPGGNVPVKGWVDSDHTVHWGPTKGPGSAQNPLGALHGAGVVCLRFQTAGGAYDGALVYYREMPPDLVDHDGMGKLCLVKVKGQYLLRVPLRGYEEGRHNLTLFNGQPKEEGVVLEAATPIIWLKL